MSDLIETASDRSPSVLSDPRPRSTGKGRNPVPHDAWLSPLLLTVLALLSGVAAVMTLGTFVDAGAATRHALWTFPAVVYLVSRMAARSRATLTGGWARRISIGFLVYMAITAVSVVLMLLQVHFGQLDEANKLLDMGDLLSGLVRFQATAWKTLPFIYLVTITALPVGFTVFMVLSMSAMALGNRLPRFWFTSNRAMTRAFDALSIVSLACFAIWAFVQTKDAETARIDRTMVEELARTGYLLSSSHLDPGPALEQYRRASGQELDDLSRADVLKSLGAVATRREYSVGQGRDFGSIGDGVSHLERVAAYVGRRVDDRSPAAARFVLRVAVGTYRENVVVTGPITIEAEDPSHAPVVASADEAKPTFSLEPPPGSREAPVVSHLTIAGGRNADTIQSGAEGRIEFSSIQSAPGHCGTTGGGVLVSNRYTGDCGANVSAAATFRDNAFVHLKRTAITASSPEPTWIYANNFEGGDAPFLLATNSAQVFVDGANLRGPSKRYALLGVRDAATLTIRNSTLGASNSCVWVEKGSGHLIVERSRFEHCDAPDFAAVRVEEGASARISDTVFVYTEGLDRPERFLAAFDVMAQVEFERTVVEGAPSERPTPVAVPQPSIESGAAVPTNAHLQPMLDYTRTEMVALANCSLRASVLEGRLAALNAFMGLRILFGQDPTPDMQKLNDEQFECIRGVLAEENAAVRRLMADGATCPAAVSGILAYSRFWSKFAPEALVLDFRGDKGSVGDRVKQFNVVASERFRETVSFASCRLSR